MPIKILENIPFDNHRVIIKLTNCHQNDNNNNDTVDTREDIRACGPQKAAELQSQVAVDKNYGLWTIIQLKDELRKRKARLTGRKKDLVQWLIKMFEVCQQTIIKLMYFNFQVG